MLNKMSEAQLSMLQAAARREDRLVTPPANARAAARKTLTIHLIDAGWVKEIKARNGATVWRNDGASGARYALKLTANGLKAATAMIEAADGERAPSAPTAVKELTPAPEAFGNEPSHVQARAPRATSKLGRVLNMLAGDAGATIGELTQATGWLEHTTRAALTGLRHRGYELSFTPKEREGASVYRIVVHGGEAAQ